MQYRLGLNYSAPKVMNKIISNFKGVDYTKAQLDVAENRATEMQNFIFNDGINQKRNGFNEVAKMEGNINGYWEFKDSEGEPHCLAYVGTTFYEITYGVKTTYNEIHIRYTPSIHENEQDVWDNYIFNNFKDRKAYGVVRGDRLYILCGIYVVYGNWGQGWELRAVRDNIDTYIPITTTNITHNSYKGKSTRASLEEINMMSTMRINKMYGERIIEISLEQYSPSDWGSAFANTLNKGFQSKTYISKEEQVSINIGIKYFDPNMGRVETFIFKAPILLDGNKHQDIYNNITEQNVDYLTSEFKSIYGAYELNYKYLADDELLDLNIKFGAKEEYIDIEYTQLGSGTELVYDLDSQNISISPNPILQILFDKGYKTYTFDQNGNCNEEPGKLKLDYFTGKLYVYINCKNNIIQEPNMSILFTTPKQVNSKPYEKIDNCETGIVFGYNGIEHLFVGGSNLTPNIDYHTSEVFLKNTKVNLPNSQNFTYFSDLSYSILGNAKTKIKSYVILNDNNLGIIKEFSPNEPSLFIREPYVTNAIDSSGNVVLDSTGSPYQKLYYKQYMSAIGEGCISQYATSNLAGDKLFLSSNGVYKIQLDYNNINTTHRYAVEASRLINPKLELYSKNQLSKATSIVFGNRYYLSMNDEEGTVYIADARFRNREDEEMNDALGYEWWVWKGVNARTWFVDLNGDLGFGDNEGHIFKFNDKDNFSDNKTIEINNGGISFDGNKFHISKNYDINKQNGILLKTGLMEELISNDELHSMIVLGEERLFANEEQFYRIIRYYNGKIISFVDAPNTPRNCVIYDVDYENYSFKIKFIVGSTDLIPSDINNKCFIARELGKEKIINIEEGVNGGHTFDIMSVGLDENGNIIPAKIVQPYGNNILATLFLKYDVRAIWFTPYMNMGTSDYSKTLRYITVVPEHILHGSANIHFVTKDNVDNPLIARLQGIDYNTYFNDLDLNSLSLEIKDFQHSFSKKLKIRNFNFLIICLESENDKNFAIENISLTYEISKRNRGVK